MLCLISFYYCKLTCVFGDPRNENCDMFFSLPFDRRVSRTTVSIIQLNNSAFNKQNNTSHNLTTEFEIFFLFLP